MTIGSTLFNWSVKHALRNESDVFLIARVKIIYFLLLLSLVKAGIAIVVGEIYGQSFQVTRGVIALVVYLGLLRVLLNDVKRVYLLTHVIIVAGAVVIWSIIFVSAQQVSIVTLQFVFMIILSSFYLLNSRWGVFYSLIGVFPVIAFEVMKQYGMLHFPTPPDALAFPGQFAVIVLNFVTFTGAHYLYQKAFNKNMREKQELNARLKSALDEAEKLAQSKSDFLSTMSHELRTPLNMVIGMSDLLRDNPRDKEQAENLKVLSFAAVSLHTLINDILDFNKLDSGKLNLEKISVNLHELCNSICSGLDMQAKEKGLDLVLNVDPLLRTQRVITDPTRLSQIIYNLLGNGIKFTPIGKVELVLRVTESNPDEVTVHFSVKDTGIGISPEKQLIIFEPFIQASSNTTRNYGGTGLGLSIVKRLLGLFNSEINLESTPGVGSEFSFDIRFIPADENSLSPESLSDEEGSLEGLRLLVAEDNVLNAYLIRKLCTKWMIKPVLVENGREAVKEATANPYDVILMDIHMPEMDGYEATRLIRKSPNGQPGKLTVIALTASVSSDLELKIAEAGMNDFIRKPFNANELYLKLKQIALATHPQLKH